MLLNKVLKDKKLIFVLLSLATLFISSAVYADEIKEIWNHISLNNAEFKSLDQKTRDIWQKFENSSIQRGLVVKTNYRPFVPVINRVIVLDTPADELAYRKYSLHIETEVINGLDTRITELILSKLSDKDFPEATIEQQFGYAKGKLGQIIPFWVAQKKIAVKDLSATEQLKLESFKRSIELDSSGDADKRRIPKSDIFYFFPEISNDMKLNFDYLYPQNDKLMFRTTYEPGRIRFGSLLDTDVKISYIHSIVTSEMLNGNISWKTSINRFTTGEEVALCDSFFYFMQESLASDDYIAPASPSLY